MSIEKFRLTTKEIRTAKRAVPNRSLWGAVDEAVADAQLRKVVNEVLLYLDRLECVDSSAIGPLFGSGWNSALEELKRSLLKANSQEVKEAEHDNETRYSYRQG